MIRNRTFTVTYELPEELFNVLEEKAKREGRPLEDVIAEYEAASSIRPTAQFRRKKHERRHQNLIVAMFGTLRQRRSQFRR